MGIGEGVKVSPWQSCCCQKYYTFGVCRVESDIGLKSDTYYLNAPFLPSIYDFSNFLLPDNIDAEEDDKQTADGITDFGHLLSLSDSLCDKAKDDSAGESDDQVDHCCI